MSSKLDSSINNRSWFERLKSSFYGILIGMAFFILSIFLLFWNESRYLAENEKLIKIRAEVISINSDSINAENDGKLVHISGDASTFDLLEDDIFKVQMSVFKMRRNVQMYQWIETSQSNNKPSTNSNDNLSYVYSKNWSEKYINSSNFNQPDKYTNPGSFPYTDVDYSAKDVKIGAFTLSRNELISQLDNYTPQTLKNSMLRLMPKEIREKATIRDQYIYMGNPDKPEIGDVRIFYDIVDQQPLSVIGEQNNNFIDSYDAGYGKIAFIKTGILSASQMISSAQNGNNNLTWVLRGAGFFSYVYCYINDS